MRLHVRPGPRVDNRWATSLGSTVPMQSGNSKFGESSCCGGSIAIYSFSFFFFLPYISWFSTGLLSPVIE